MGWKTLFAAVALLALVTVIGCSGNMSSTARPPGSVPFSISVTDTPPSTVTVLSFEVTITGAVLHSATGKPDVTLVSSSNPVQVEVEHLQTDNAFLKTTNVPPDTYSGITLSFANPELTIFNSGAAFTLAGVNCAANTACEFQPSVSAVVNFSSSPFPIMVSANTPSGMLIDINVNNVLDSNLGINFNAPGAIGITQLPLPGRPAGEMDEFDDLVGIVSNPSNNQFALQTLRGSFTITVDSNTEFNDFENCAADNFTCLQNGQLVQVNVTMMTEGNFLAREVELEENVAEEGLRGIVFKVDSATQFELAVDEELQQMTGVAIGDPITVTLTSSPTFQVDTGGLPVPSTLVSAFQGATDTSQLMPGQDVQIHIVSVTLGPPISISTDSVRLEQTHLTGTVSGAPSGSNFNVTPFSSLLVNNGGSTIQVQTFSQTEFEDVSGIGGLSSGMTVSVKGLLFKGTPPVLIASKVCLRLPGD